VKVSKNFKTPVASILLVIAASAVPARADTITYDFVGDCADCYNGTGTANATLVLSADYTLGSEINSSNFVSFTYDGTNLLAGFTILDDSPGLFIADYSKLPVGLGPADFYVQANLGEEGFYTDFQSMDNGEWGAGVVNMSVPSDMGTNGTFSSSSAASEPASIFLLGSALLVVGMAARNRPSQRAPVRH
jgi:hypothetical protein